MERGIGQGHHKPEDTPGPEPETIRYSTQSLEPQTTRYPKTRDYAACSTRMEAEEFQANGLASVLEGHSYKGSCKCPQGIYV